ncbi:hypothetical protein Fcan01_11470 [Folsomia candida]|uniref:Uncharacterized protein n=1 Tax=Folsomia candida TaxID=158441 RepID=A0A226EAW8_FOLCA|nr:hypothetical protein Fcan01_11470 [Folsomia candida]
MATYGSWLAVKRYLTICKHLYPPPWVWDTPTMSPTPTPISKLIPWITMNLGMITILISTIILILHKIIGGSPNDPDFHHGVALVWGIVTATSIIGTAISHFLASLNLEFCWWLGAGHNLSQRVNTRKFKQKRWTNWKSDYIGIAMHLMIGTLLLGSSVGFIYPIVRHGDPCFFIFRTAGLAPRAWWVKLLRSVIQGSIFVHGSLVYLGAMLPVWVGLSLLIKLIQSLSHPKNSRGSGPVKEYLNDKLIYDQLQILMFEGNKLVYYIAPIGFMMGMTLCILLGSVVVAVDQLPIGIKLECCLMWIGACTATQVLFPFAAAVSKGSEQARKFWKVKKNQLLKWERKDVKCWRRIVVDVGPFFGIVNSTATTFLYHTMDNTAELIIWLKFNYSGSTG